MSACESMERRARRAHLAWAIDYRFGRCDTCGRTHGEDGRPLLVARQNRTRRYECVDCWDQGGRT